MIAIYHNNRCGKSRCALERLEKTGQAFELVEYLKNPPTVDELRRIVQLLHVKPLDIIRQKEALFQEKFKGRQLSDEEWLQVLAEHPSLLERPIVVAGEKAWVARDEGSLLDMEAHIEDRMTS